MIASLSEEYKKHVKPFWQEEFFDYMFYRPLAFLVVRGTYSLPLVPNHFSILALSTALISGCCLAIGGTAGFVYGGIGILLFGVWDCCDGMLARMKGNGGRYGEFVDMLVDVLSAFCFYGGLAWGLRETGNLYPGLVVASGGILALHAGVYNFYKKQFIFYTRGNPRGRLEEREHLERLRGESEAVWDRFLLGAFLLFARLQKREGSIVLYNVEDYVKRNKGTLFLWGAIAGSGHLFLLACSLVARRVELYFGFALVFANLWLMGTWWFQVRVNGRTEVVGG